MESWNDRVSNETTKARTVLYEKRIFGLAKQSSAGLANLGIKYEMTSLANVIRMALRYKEAGGVCPKGYSKDRREEMERSGRVFDAVMSYDYGKVAGLLNVSPEREKTFGNGATKR